MDRIIGHRASREDQGFVIRDFTRFADTRAPAPVRAIDGRPAWPVASGPPAPRRTADTGGHKEKTGSRRSFGSASLRAQRGSVPPVSSAASCILSPTFSTSLPTPLTVLHALSVPAENRAIRMRAIKRFMWILLELRSRRTRERRRHLTRAAVKSTLKNRMAGARGRPPRGAAFIDVAAASTPRSIAHQRRLAEQALDQVHRELGGAVARVERGIDLDDVERPEQPGVGDHLHDQLRLAVVHAAGDR